MVLGVASLLVVGQRRPEVEEQPPGGAHGGVQPVPRSDLLEWQPGDQAVGQRRRTVRGHKAVVTGRQPALASEELVPQLDAGAGGVGAADLPAAVIQQSEPSRAVDRDHQVGSVEDQIVDDQRVGVGGSPVRLDHLDLGLAFQVAEAQAEPERSAVDRDVCADRDGPVECAAGPPRGGSSLRHLRPDPRPGGVEHRDVVRRGRQVGLHHTAEELHRSARAVGLTKPADSDDERRLRLAEPPDVVGDVGGKARPARGEVVTRQSGGYVVTENVQFLAEPRDLLA